MPDQAGLFPVDADDEYLLKHVNAVALMPVPGGRRISLLGRRLFNVLLHRAQETGEQDEYQARMHEIVRDAGYNSNDTAPIRKILRELMSTTVEWQSPTHGEIETWDACNLLSGAGTTKDKRTGAVTVRWRYDSKVRAQLLSPDRYARLSLEAITQLSTHSAMALYEICARYVDNPRHLTARQHWRWWRPVLTGVSSDDSKAEYRFFKRDVLHKAIAEINACTNLEVRGPIEHKEKDNRTVAEIQFEVFAKSTYAPSSPFAPRPLGETAGPLQQVLVEDLPLIGRAINAGVRQSEAEELIRKHGASALSTALAELEKRLKMPSEKVGAVQKPGSWLRVHMERVAKLAPAQGRAGRAGAGPGAEPGPSAESLQKHRAAWTDEWLRRRKERLRLGFQELPAAAQQSLVQAFRQSLQDTGQTQLQKRLDSSGWQHRMVLAAFTRFYALQEIGEQWDKPSAEDILGIAAELALTGQQPGQGAH
jgi:hypothetical protein